MLRKIVFGFLFFFLGHLVHAQITFIIESLPNSTPGTDTIFISGTFNNWAPNDPHFALQRQLNGQLAVTIPALPVKVEYKFTRGSWTKVETDSENQYTTNRIFIPGASNKVFVRIDNWLDLGGAKQLNYFIFYFFACAFQGIALCLLAYRIHKKDERKFTPLLIINTVLTGLLILVVLHETANQIWQSYFTFVFHICLFCWGPLVFSFIYSFSFARPYPKLYLFFIPAGLALFFVVIRILNIRAFTFLSETVLPPLTWGNTLFIGTSFIYNLLICFWIMQRFPFLKVRTNNDPKINFLFYFFWTSLIALLLVPVNVLLIIVGIHHSFIEDFHSIAIALSILIFIETYFLWRYPEIIREEKLPSLPTEDSQNWAEKLNSLMKKNKPYKNADLSVSDLAEMLGTKPHILSKVINDTCHKNFRDFVNTYRIEEFITLANSKEFRHYTFLALAQEVGFNSKSTFNLAFKKLMNQSPRDYFKSKEVL